uniref:Uncharacterized protein n=1 Tax=Brassica oleracea var. oleracea TaxID=109376 RepID=A0A0D3D457_BRAOL
MRGILRWWKVSREWTLTLMAELGNSRARGPGQAEVNRRPVGFARRLTLSSRSCIYSQHSHQTRRQERPRVQAQESTGSERTRAAAAWIIHAIDLERRVEGFGPLAFPVPPELGGACVGGVPPEIGLEALALPRSRQLMAMAIGHDYYQKVPMKMNISHGGVCICMFGVLLSCDPAAYVRPVAQASNLFRAGGVNSDSIRVFNLAAEMLS